MVTCSRSGSRGSALDGEAVSSLGRPATDEPHRGRGLRGADEESDAEAVCECASQERDVEARGLEGTKRGAASAEAKRPLAVADLLTQEAAQRQLLMVHDAGSWLRAKNEASCS